MTLSSRKGLGKEEILLKERGFTERKERLSIDVYFIFTKTTPTVRTSLSLSAHTLGATFFLPSTHGNFLNFDGLTLLVS